MLYGLGLAVLVRVGDSGLVKLGAVATLIGARVGLRWWPVRLEELVVHQRLHTGIRVVLHHVLWWWHRVHSLVIALHVVLVSVEPLWVSVTTTDLSALSIIRPTLRELMSLECSLCREVLVFRPDVIPCRVAIGGIVVG